MEMKRKRNDSFFINYLIVLVENDSDWVERERRVIFYWVERERELQKPTISVPILDRILCTLVEKEVGKSRLYDIPYII